MEGIRAAILHPAVRRRVSHRASGSHATGHICQPTGHIGGTTGHIGRPDRPQGGLTGHIGRLTRKDHCRLVLVVGDYLCWREIMSFFGEQLTVTLTSRRETTDHSVFHSSKLVGASHHRVSIVLVGWMSTGRRRRRSRHLGRHRVKGVVVDNADVTEPVERHIINSHHQYDRVCLRMSSANGDRTRMDCAIGVDDHLRRTMSGLMVWRTR